MVGKDLLIAVGGVIVAAQRSCTLNMDVDTIEVCSPVDGAWKKHIPTTIGWQVQCAGLIYNPEHADALIDAISKREMVRISFYDPELRMLRSGYAIMTTLEEGGSIGDMASQSMQFLGSGELEKVKAVVATPDGDPYELQNSIAVNENHCIVPTGECEVYEYVFSSPTRLTLEVDGQLRVAVLVGADIDTTADWIENENSISMFKNELAHVSDVVAALGAKDSVVVEPGNYCVIVNKGDGQEYKLTAMSIPVN